MAQSDKLRQHAASQQNYPDVTAHHINDLRRQLRKAFDESGASTDEKFNFRPLLASVVRLIFHDCAGPNNDDPNIISTCNGCIDVNLSDNAGLTQLAINPLEELFQDPLYKWSEKMSRADFWAASGYLHSHSLPLFVPSNNVNQITQISQ